MVREDVWQALVHYPHSDSVGLDCLNCGQQPWYHEKQRQCPKESINNKPFKEHAKGTRYEHVPRVPRWSRARDRARILRTRWTVVRRRRVQARHSHHLGSHLAALSPSSSPRRPTSPRSWSPKEPGDVRRTVRRSRCAPRERAGPHRRPSREGAGRDRAQRKSECEAWEARSATRRTAVRRLHRSATPCSMPTTGIGQARGFS